MASNEFVDLDEIVPGTGFSKKQDEPLKKKEPVQKKENPEPSIEVYGDDKEPSSQEPEKKQDEKKKLVKEESKTREDLPRFEEKQKSNGVNGKKEKTVSLKEASSGPKQDKFKEQETKKQVPKTTFKQIMAKKRDSKKLKLSKEKERKSESRVVGSRKEKSEKKTARKETNWTMIALLILAVIILGVIIYVALKFDFTKSEQESVVAVVNGQPIYKSELMNRYNLLKSTANPFITEEQVLNLTIMDKLLLQEAAKKGITTSDEEVSLLLNEIMIQNNIDEASLREDLSAKNVSYDFLVQMYKGTLTVNKLINDSFSNLTVSNKELQAFYEENKESLKVPDMVQVRHMLFLFGNESEQETYSKADDVFNMIKQDKSNFCELGEKYNQDMASVEFCGEYNFSIDYPFVPEFLDAGFSMKQGEIKIVKTQLGYHIMYKVADLPGYVPELNDIKAQLEPALLREKTMLELDSLITELRNDAIIEIYAENISTKRFSEVTAAEEIAVPDIQEEVQRETVSGETPVSEEEVIDVEIPSQGEVTKEVISTPKSQKMLLANCLNDKGVRVFIASWSPDSQDQLVLFGEYASSLKIVECDPDVANADLAECTNVLKKKYPTWPTWQIEGTLYEGIQSLSALSKYSGCPY